MDAIVRIFDGTVQDGRTNSDTHRRRKGPPPQERKSDAQTRTVVSGYVFIVKLIIPRINLTAYFYHTCSRGDEARDMNRRRARDDVGRGDRRVEENGSPVCHVALFVDVIDDGLRLCD